MLRLLIDENVDHRILRGLRRRVPQVDFVTVAQIGLVGTPDIDLLRWAARENRTMLTHDVSTMTDYAKQLVSQTGAHGWCDCHSRQIGNWQNNRVS